MGLGMNRLKCNISLHLCGTAVTDGSFRSATKNQHVYGSDWQPYSLSECLFSLFVIQSCAEVISLTWPPRGANSHCQAVNESDHSSGKFGTSCVAESSCCIFYPVNSILIPFIKKCLFLTFPESFILSLRMSGLCCAISLFKLKMEK